MGVGLGLMGLVVLVGRGWSCSLVAGRESLVVLRGRGGGGGGRGGGGGGIVGIVGIGSCWSFRLVIVVAVVAVIVVFLTVVVSVVVVLVVDASECVLNLSHVFNNASATFTGSLTEEAHICLVPLSTACRKLATMAMSCWKSCTSNPKPKLLNSYTLNPKP